MRLLCIFALVAVVGLVAGEEGARLLASKSLLNRYAVEGRDLTLQYNIYNVGTSAALEVELSDDSFPPEDFGIVSGMLNVKWDRIAPYPHSLRTFFFFFCASFSPYILNFAQCFITIYVNVVIGC
uniref:Translocon-associated protein subunit beta-like n=1 Tax=Cyprinus carpio TaxID=7962 RepID=A0A8C2HEK0_CYPCA